jgi:hypothetical protein
MEMTILIRFNAVMAMRRVSDQAFCRGTRFRSGMQGLLIAHCDVVMSELVFDSLDSFVETWLIELYCFGQRGVVN